MVKKRKSIFTPSARKVALIAGAGTAAAGLGYGAYKIYEHYNDSLRVNAIVQGIDNLVNVVPNTVHAVNTFVTESVPSTIASTVVAADEATTDAYYQAVATAASNSYLQSLFRMIYPVEIEDDLDSDDEGFFDVVDGRL